MKKHQPTEAQIDAVIDQHNGDPRLVAKALLVCDHGRRLLLMGEHYGASARLINEMRDKAEFSKGIEAAQHALNRARALFQQMDK